MVSLTPSGNSGRWLGGFFWLIILQIILHPQTILSQEDGDGESGNDGASGGGGDGGGGGGGGNSNFGGDSDQCNMAYEADDDQFGSVPELVDQFFVNGVGGDSEEEEEGPTPRNFETRKKKRPPTTSSPSQPTPKPPYGNCESFPDTAWGSQICAQFCRNDTSSCHFNRHGSYCLCNDGPALALDLSAHCFWVAFTKNYRPPPNAQENMPKYCEEQCMRVPKCQNGGPKFNAYLCPVNPMEEPAKRLYACVCNNYKGGCIRRIDQERFYVQQNCTDICGGQPVEGIAQCRVYNPIQARLRYCFCLAEPRSPRNYRCGKNVATDRGKYCKRLCSGIPIDEGGPYLSSSCVSTLKNIPTNRKHTCACYKAPAKSNLEFFEDWPLPKKPYKAKFKTWSDDNKWLTWAYSPKSAMEVLTIANWAKDHEFQLRASGQQHSWAPLTLPVRGLGSRSERYPGRKDKYILLKTKKLNRMGILSKVPGKFSFWTQPGVFLEEVLTQLEDHGMGLLHHPAVGRITMGGAIAIGGHGTAVRANNEKLSKGHSYGSLSNLIISMKAVVYNKTEKKYVLKRFHRTHEDIGAFLVNLGRTFITNMTLRAGPLQYLRSQSHFNIPASELFASPKEIDDYNSRLDLYGKPMRTLSHFLDVSGRVETILFPNTKKPWLKVWTVVEKKRPKVRKCKIYNPLLGLTCTRKLHKPYPYILADHSSQLPGFEMKLQKWQKSGKHKVTRRLGWFLWKMAQISTSLAQKDVWGTSKNVFLYVKSTTLKYHANGYAVVTSRDRVQDVAYKAYKIYLKMVRKYDGCRTYPVNGPFEIRVSGVDDPSDVGIKGARSSFISATRPVLPEDGQEHMAKFDTVVWIDTFSYTDTQWLFHYMNEVEREFYEAFSGGWSVFRIEWSKGFAYKTCENYGWPWGDRDFLKNVTFRDYNDEWQNFTRVTSMYDPYNVFSNYWFEDILELQKGALDEELL